MKYWSIVGLLIGIALFTGCKQVAERAQDGDLHASAVDNSLPAGAVIADVIGQAITEDSSKPDDRIRTAAILDGLRKLALRESAYLETSGLDTVIAIGAWDGIEVLGVTVRKGGVVLLDSVTVTMTQYNNDRLIHYRWKSLNMMLVEPDAETSPLLDQLIAGLKGRGIGVEEGKGVARGLWEEKLAVRRWSKR